MTTSVLFTLGCLVINLIDVVFFFFFFSSVVHIHFLMITISLCDSQGGSIGQGVNLEELRCRLPYFFPPPL